MTISHHYICSWKTWKRKIFKYNCKRLVNSVENKFEIVTKIVLKTFFQDMWGLDRNQDIGAVRKLVDYFEDGRLVGGHPRAIALPGSPTFSLNTDTPQLIFMFIGSDRSSLHHLFHMSECTHISRRPCLPLYWRVPQRQAHHNV